VRQYRAQEKQVTQLKRQARNHGNYYAEAEPKVAFIVRIRG
jgi:large subunit ribosomal protein L7e